MQVDNLEFHHIGVACDAKAFARSTDRLSLELLGYRPEGGEWVDEVLGIKGQFLIGGAGCGAPRLELVAPHGNRNRVEAWLKQGVKLYHLAFLAADIVGEIDRLRTQRAKLMLPPTPAIAFDNRRVAFLMLPNLLLIELIEKG